MFTLEKSQQSNFDSDLLSHCYQLGEESPSNETLPLLLDFYSVNVKPMTPGSVTEIKDDDVIQEPPYKKLKKEKEDELITTIRQQMQIDNLNKHILTLNVEYRQNLIELNNQAREEKEALKLELAKKSECISKLEKEAKTNRQEIQFKEHLIRIENQLKAQTQEVADSHKRIIQLENELIQTKTQVKVDLTALKEKIQQLEVVTKPKERESNSLYTWSIVESRSGKCNEIYGYKASDILRLYTQVNVILKSMKMASDERFFLLFLYFFKHYHSMKAMQEKFGINVSDIQARLLKMITTVGAQLFVVSKREESAPINKSQRVYRCYFIVIDKPVETAMSQKYYSALYKQHGLYIHCVHHIDASGKVIAFQANNKKIVDKEWLKTHMDLNTKDDDANDGTYEMRMKNKFAIVATRYRGNLTELPNIVECLLALTNFDIHYGNPIENRPETVEMTD